MVQGHVPDVKGKILHLIEHMEGTQHSHIFRVDEITEAAAFEGIPEEATLEAIDELMEDRVLHVVEGTDGLIARTVWRDYSPAGEELPEY
jgi:hypothetical protein